MKGTQLDELGEELAREMHRSASSRPVDLVDAQSKLQIRIARDRRNFAVAAVTVAVLVIVSAATLLVIEQRREGPVIDSPPRSAVSVTVVSRASEPRGPEAFEWPLLQALRVSPLVSSVRWEAAAGYSDGARAVEAAAEESNVVLLSGPDLQDHIAYAAQANPKTAFVVVDGTDPVPGAHVVNIRAEQAAFLAGALAASVTRSGQLGVVFGARLETTEALAAGFAAGAREVNPDIGVDVRYVTVHPDLSGFGNLPAQQELAEQIYAGGADVVLGEAAIPVAARLSADGQQRWAIGVGNDDRANAGAAEAEVVLTSVLKDLGGATTDVLELIASGGLDGDLVLGLASGRTGLGPSAPAAAPYNALLGDLGARIRAGDITVPVTEP